MVCKQETAANASERAAPLLRTEGDNHVTADHAKRSTNLPRLLSTGSSPAPRSIRSLLVDDYPTAHKPSRSSQPAPPPPVLEATHGNRDASQPIPTMSTSSPANPGSTRPTETPQQSRAGRMPQGDSPDIDQQQPQTPTSRSFDGPGGTVVHQHIQHYHNYNFHVPCNVNNYHVPSAETGQQIGEHTIVPQAPRDHQPAPETPVSHSQGPIHATIGTPAVATGIAALGADPGMHGGAGWGRDARGRSIHTARNIIRPPSAHEPPAEPALSAYHSPRLPPFISRSQSQLQLPQRRAPRPVSAPSYPSRLSSSGMRSPRDPRALPPSLGHAVPSLTLAPLPGYDNIAGRSREHERELHGTEPHSKRPRMTRSLSLPQPPVDKYTLRGGLLVSDVHPSVSNSSSPSPLGTPPILPGTSASVHRSQYTSSASGRGASVDRLRGETREAETVSEGGGVNDWEAVVLMYTTGAGTVDGTPLRDIGKGTGGPAVPDRKLLEKRRTIGKTFERLGKERFERAIGYKWENGVRGPKQRMYSVINRCRVVNGMKKFGQEVPQDAEELANMIDIRLAQKAAQSARAIQTPQGVSEPQWRQDTEIGRDVEQEQAYAELPRAGSQPGGSLGYRAGPQAPSPARPHGGGPLRDPSPR